MSKINSDQNVIPSTCMEPELGQPASYPPLVALGYPPAPITDDGRLRLGAQSLALPAEKTRIAIGAQSPMFPPSLIADEGLVRLGAQSPVL